MPNIDHLYEIDERFRGFEDHSEGILVSLAGPGTGKTFSILRRIANLLIERRLGAETICYVTFIKEIANAFRSDYSEEFEHNHEIEGVPRISTLHSLACRLIRNRGFSIGYDGELFFTSVAPSKDTFESKVFLSDLTHYVNHSHLNTNAKIRNSLYPVKEAWRDARNIDELEGLQAIAHAAYIELARAYRIIDWDHTIAIAYQLYLSPENHQAWLTRIDHLLIDEYQDFNRAEQLLISSMISDVTSCVIVVDDDQSLYSSEGGAPDGLRNLFVSEDADQVSLVRCRRCRQTIVEHANTFLNTMTPNPRPMLPFHEGGAVESLRFKSSKAECEYLVDFLRNCIDELPEEPQPRDGIVCLFPTKKSLQFYFEKLSEHIPCYSTRFEIEESRQRLTHALNLCARPGQKFSERLLLQYFSEIKPKHHRSLVDIVVQRGLSPIQACQVMIEDGTLRGTALQSAQTYISTCVSLSSRDPRLIAEHLEEWTEIKQDELINLLDEFLSSLQYTDQETEITNLCDSALPSTARPPLDYRAILFMTMHGSKGLTRHTVVMPGLEDAWLPGTSQGASIEEKRRLFYVALTRATDHVLITHPARRARGDPMNFETPGRSQVSRFVGYSGISTLYQQ